MSALDELLEQEMARLNGRSLLHPDGIRSRLARLAAAHAELSALRREAAEQPRSET